MIAAILLSLTVAPASAALTQALNPTVAGIRAERAHCRETGSYPGPFELMACDEAAMGSAAALTSRSTGTADLPSLLRDLFEPQMVTLTGGEDALAIRVVVSAAHTEFVLRRAAMLAGAGEAPPAGDTAVSNPFESLRANADAVGLNRRWIAIRAADCAAYPVPDCPARLDALMRDMLAGTQPDH